MNKHIFLRWSGYCALIFLLLIIEACSRNPVTGKKQIILMSESQEKALGVESDPGIIAEYGLYDDKKLQDFINLKGKQMGSISHRSNIEYNFRILDSPVVNAFAVPGGYVYFTRGIMAHFNNEAEFAGVLGHEIGHITARHSAQQQTNQMLGQIAVIGGLIAVPSLGQFAEQLMQGSQLLFLKWGRDHESQSDMLGVDYSTKIGYNSFYMADFFKTLGRISDQAGQRIPTFLSTHPDPGDRYNNVKKLSQEAQAKLTNVSSLQVNRDQYLRMIDGIIYGEDPRQGYVENNMFYHPELKFQFPVPKGWKTQNSPQQFAMASADQKAMMILTLGQGKTLDEAAAGITKQYNLKVTESAKINVNGLPGLAMISEQLPQQQQGQPTAQTTQAAAKVQLLTYLIQYNNLIYVMHGVAQGADFNTYFNTFKSTMQDFRPLTDQSKINVLPDRISVKTVANEKTLTDVFRTHNVPQKRMEEMAIVNSMQLTDPVQRGMLIKVIQK